MLRSLGDLTADGVRASGSPRATRPPRCWRSSVAERRAAAGPDRRRGALDRRRGRRPLPRRARRAAAAGPAGDLPRGAPRRDASPWSAATPAPTAPSRPRSSADRYGVDPTPALRELERDGRAGPRRAAARRHRARVVRLRRPAPGAPRQPRPPARARSRRPTARARPLPAELAERRRPPRRRRRPRPPARGAGAAAGRRADARRSGSATCCRAASAPTRPAWLDELCTSGELVWIGAGALGRSDGRVALYFREDVRLAGPPPANAKLEPPEGEVHDAIRERLAAGPRFWLDLRRRPRPPGRGAPHRALGPRLGGRGDQRRLRAAARAAPARGRRRPSAAAAASPAAARRRRRRPGPLVADRAALRERARRPARGCAPRPS